MEIRIQIKGRVFSICIGRETKWFSQVYLISIVENFYENQKLEYAKMKFSFWEKW